MRTSWSYSSYSVFKQCPYKYNKQYNEGIKQPPTQPLLRGLAIHAKAEQLLLGNITGMPDELKDFSKEFKGLKKAGGIPEEEWGCTDLWEDCEWSDKENIWLRGKVDVHVWLSEGKLCVIDFKTGGIYDSHADQASLYATLAYNLYDITQVDVEFWYLDKDHIETYHFTEKTLKQTTIQWYDKAETMLNAKRFKKTPGSHCKWCHIRSDKQGDCTKWKGVLV